MDEQTLEKNDVLQELLKSEYDLAKHECEYYTQEFNKQDTVYKAIVVDLWTLYFFVKVQAQEVMSHFKTIYITYDTVSMALQEINQVNDDDIRRVLIHLQREGNVKLLSPTLEQQLTVRNPSYNFMEVHSACLLAQELNCPAFVGEFRFEIPEQLRSKVIRPDNLKEVMDCVMDKKLLEAE